MERKISLCLTTYNRYSLTIESISQVIEDDRISEIIIYDDASEDDSFEKLKEYYKDVSKVKLFTGAFNLNCYAAKHRAVELSSNNWLVIFDSDNVIDKSYIDRIFEIEQWEEDTFYMPSFAREHFDYRPYEGLTFTKENIAEYIDLPMISTCLNCMNFFCHKDQYQKAYDGTIEAYTADSILINYNNFKNGGKMFIVSDLSYFHRVHDMSHYKLQNHLTGKLYGKIETELRNLK